VPESVGRRLGQLEHALDCEALDLWNSSNKDLVPANVLQCLGQL
jgi:hypothetical protein